MNIIARRLTHTIGVGLIGLSVGGCGVAQSVKDSTVDAAKWAFTTQVKTLKLDIAGRSSLNTVADGQSLSTVIRVYQLKDRQAIDQIEYVQLQDNDIDALKPDLLSTSDLVLRPNANASISESMNDDTQFVAVVAFFRDDRPKSTWRIVLPRKQWKQDDPVRIEVRDSSLALVGKGSTGVKQQATIHSTPAPVATSTHTAQPQSAVATQAVKSGPPAKLTQGRIASADDWTAPL